MKLAIMQPYFFPYIGYFQLVNAVNSFVLLDDVNFIKKGYIHRNKISLNNSDYTFTIPLKKASQNKLIKDIKLHDRYDSWKDKFLETIRHAYAKTSNYEEISIGIRNTLYREKTLNSLCQWAIRYVVEKLDISTNLCSSSHIFTGDTTGQERIIRICQSTKALQYINAIGGKKLYDRNAFNTVGIDLKFIRCELEPNKHFNPYYSILDLLFRFPKDDIKDMLYKYRLEG